MPRHAKLDRTAANEYLVGARKASSQREKAVDSEVGKMGGPKENLRAKKAAVREVLRG